MNHREISTLPLAPTLRTKLSTAGYRCVGDFQGLDLETLCSVTGLSKDDAECVLKIIEKSGQPKLKPVSAASIYSAREDCPCIMTFSEQIDVGLGGAGIECGQVTELSGLPGTGKTQLCLQLSCDAQIPTVFGGLESEVLYIDTEGGLVMDRLVDIVKATVKHCHFMAKRETQSEVVSALQSLSTESLLSGIHIQKCYSCSQLLAAMVKLPDFLHAHPQVKLVVVDSISFHLRHEFEDMSQRTRVVTKLAQDLLRLARTHNIAVVLTNQMTTKVHQGPDKGSHHVPCLGESWGHACTTRLILQSERDCRQAWIHKSPHTRQSRVPFQITRDGIRDVVLSSKEPSIGASGDDASTIPPYKCQRTQPS